MSCKAPSEKSNARKLCSIEKIHNHTSLGRFRIEVGGKAKGHLSTDVSGRILNVARSLDLGDIAPLPSGRRALNYETDCADPYAIYGLLELARKTGDASLVKLASRVADNLLHKRFRNGLFIQEPGQTYAKFDELAPLALLQLAAIEQGKADVIPEAWPGVSYFQCPYDGLGRTKDNFVIYGDGKKSGELEQFK